jgi:23S rRNA (guanosine2251-2'-O)-methyltransferase
MSKREFIPKKAEGARGAGAKPYKKTGERGGPRRTGKGFGGREDGYAKPAGGEGGRASYARRDDSDRPSRTRGESGYKKTTYGTRDEGFEKRPYRRGEEGPGKGYGARGDKDSKAGYGSRGGKARPAYDRSEERREKPAFKRGDKKAAPAFDKKVLKDKPARESYAGKVAADNEEEDDSLEERSDRIEGRNPVFEALKSERPLNKIFIEKDSSDSALARIAALAREREIPIQYVERRKLDMMSTTRIHQGVILEAAAHEYVEVEDILEKAAQKGEDPFIILLDGITDTNNMGSIIRSAECAGAHGIIIPKRRSATLNATVAKVAAGAQEFVPVARVSNLAQTVRDLKTRGIWITGADMAGEKLYSESDLKGPIGLVIGSEGEGISRIVKEECDYLVRIPLKGKISSLNAGVAAALIMFEIARKRG